MIYCAADACSEPFLPDAAGRIKVLSWQDVENRQRKYGALLGAMSVAKVWHCDEGAADQKQTLACSAVSGRSKPLIDIVLAGERCNITKMRFAVLADIHGNAHALEAVLNDMEALGIWNAVNLGDCFSGPLNAAGTATLLMDRKFTSIRGNHDRYLIDQDRSEMGPSDKAAFDQLDKTHLAWIASLPETLTVFDDVFLCHGTPTSDSTYWLEHVEENGTVRPSTLQEIQAHAIEVDANLILCAHTHIPRCVCLPGGRTILNPGSVGCPAYDDDLPVYHLMQTGHPNASYAVVEAFGDRWSFSFRSVPYRYDKASELAAKNGRPDWARSLATGWFSE